MPTSTPEDFGVDRYCYIDGVRFKVGMVATIRPFTGETNGDFQRRIDVLAQTLLKSYGATTINTDFEKAAGGFTQCIIDVTYPPRAAAEIADDNRPAGGRVVLIRGGRGHKRSA